MSMHSWTVTGFGVNEEDVCKCSLDKKVSFIKKFLPVQYKEMSETENYNDWIDKFEDEHCNVGFGVLFTMAMTKYEEEDITFIHCDDKGAIIYEDRLPWEMSDRAKNMTADDMTNMFNKYLDELDCAATVQRQSVEIYG